MSAVERKMPEVLAEVGRNLSPQRGGVREFRRGATTPKGGAGLSRARSACKALYYSRDASTVDSGGDGGTLPLSPRVCHSSAQGLNVLYT
ncbi:MAG: hypothetical protein IJ301_04435 [Clostridia bacterium]|nr:hypothetical protein [Clostridia bacterium]